MLKYLVSTKTAQGGTVKTLIDTITLPANSKALLGAWVYAIGGAGLTTLINSTGILELESPDVNLQPCQVPISPTGVLTNGIANPDVKVWPLNAVVKGGERISGYVTMDLTQTIANTCRFGLVVDVTNS